MDVENKPVAIIIDNLDRCLPESAVSLLESIVLYLSAKNCVYFLAVDDSAIASYISSRYAGMAIKGVDFLEKIMNFNVHLPDAVRPEVLHKYLGNLTVNLFKLDFPEEDVKAVIRLITGIVRLCNPRRLKKVVNRYIAFLEFTERFQDTPEGKNARAMNRKDIFFGIALYHGWPDFYTRVLALAQRVGDCTAVGIEELLEEFSSGRAIDEELRMLVKRHLNVRPDALKNFEAISKALYWCGIHTRFG